MKVRKVNRPILRQENCEMIGRVQQAPREPSRFNAGERERREGIAK